MHLTVSMYGCEVESWVCLIFHQGVVWYMALQVRCESVCQQKKSSIALLSTRGAWPAGHLEIILF